MKKVLWLALLGAAAYAIWKKVAADRDERNLWAEVTDPVS